MRSEDQQRMVEEVVRRVMEGEGSHPAGVEAVFFETLYDERQRVQGEKDRKKAGLEEKYYRRLQSEFLKSNPTRQRDILSEVVRNFTREVLGHFDMRMYQVATRVVPYALNLLLNTLSPLRLLRDLPRGLGRLDDQIKIQGEIQSLQKLAKLGTCIMVPTHVSNLDSILVGYMLHRLGLPPFIYGAGLNLFSNKVMGFFMDHLGAYKVDRRKKAKLYKEVLKTYAGYSMELGYHNLFFPGGTRSRSGAVESKLKMGLLGMGLNAYIHNLKAGKKRPDIYVFPCTINYQLVLEAETLIEDYLKEVGKSRYIIEDDEFSNLKRILEFINRLFALESRIHLVVSAPLDVFGNFVDEKGRSHDHRGRVIERQRYVMSGDRPCFEEQRDREYTQELGQSILQAFARDNVVGGVQLVCRVVFDWLKEVNPGMDLYRLLRSGGSQAHMPLTDTYRRLELSLQALKGAAKNSRVRLDESLRGRDTAVILSEALAHLRDYHEVPALERRGDRLIHRNRNLIFYYQNRVPVLGGRL